MKRCCVYGAVPNGVTERSNKNEDEAMAETFDPNEQQEDDGVIEEI